MSFELVTFDELKKVLKLDKDTLPEYPSLSVLKGSVEKAIENFLGRTLESLERTESVYLNSRTKMVPLKALPVTDVDGVVATDAYGNTEDLTINEDYRITPYGLRLFSKYTDVDLAVTYTGGYATAATGSVQAIPEAISRAALLQTVYEFQKGPNLGAEMVSTEGGSITYPELGLLKHVKELLMDFVHPLKLGI